MLEIKNVSFSYDKNKLFDNFSMKASTGACLAIMAKSGRGKTTLLNLCAGLLKPTKGEIICKGIVSYSFQDPRLIPNLTVTDNLKVVLKNSVRSDVTSLNILTELGLSDAVRLYPHELSGGMAKRVSIARALIYPSDILLLDEPFAGLDTETKLITADIIKKYRNGRTSLSVIHDVNDAELLSAEIIEI